MERSPRPWLVALAVTLLASRPVAAHVDYVTDPVGETINGVAFLVETLTDPVNAALFGGAGLAAVLAVTAYFWYRPIIPDLPVLRETLATYSDLVPWMLRLSLGLPLVGAGFQGYLFAPTRAARFAPEANPFLRLLLIGVGFLILFGLATRIVATIGLATYLVTVATNPAAVLAMEYVPGFLAVMVLGGGRPSADDILQRVASTSGTYYGRVDPVHRLKARLDDAAGAYRPFVPLILRVGMGVAFVYLGVTQKLGDPARSLAVVEKYGLTNVVPVDPAMWVVGAGVTEAVVGLALLVGLLTRASAATAFLLFTLTLFGLPDDPVLAHVTLFGMASAVFTLGAGPFSVDEYLASERETTSVTPAD